MRSLVGRASNGIQIQASVTVEFGEGGEPTRHASTSAKSSSLAVSTQQNSADTASTSKPIPGSASWGGPFRAVISSAVDSGRVIYNHTEIGIHMQKVTQTL
ncbi:hypothetical protein JOB18_001795 [Solea senegalensis]|uniref:Uncharacterized protein n=1 Tax=Solea senegalensis TaxID=28829 RepID=A0AAV6RVT9_SOLSE|nr:hypothetical protein JOB18_001795 [Solea senegalensis]